MRHQSLVLLALTWSAALVPASVLTAQPLPVPTIHRATLQPETGVLTIAGTGLGADLIVTVDGQAVDVLPGASATQLEVLVPATVATMTGTFRLTVSDPVRRVGDGFVVASTVGATVAPGALATGTTVSAGHAPAPADVARATTPATHAPATPSVAPYLIEGATNTAVGLNALDSVTTGARNTAAGRSSLDFNTTGNDNVAVGYGALQGLSTGIDNTAVGSRALEANDGSQNTATGQLALGANTTGSLNTASGALALRAMTIGSLNTAMGGFSLFNSDMGVGNTASGSFALFSATGNFNTAVGESAGENATTGQYNVFIGADVVGTASDTNTIRIGLPFSAGVGQNATFIAGIFGTAVAAGTGHVVAIDANGRLGSSAVAPNNAVGSAQVINDSLIASDLAAGAVGTSELGDDAVTAAKVAFNYAASTSEGGAATDLACTGCVSAGEVGFSFATLGANTFAGTQAIGAGNLDLAPSTATEGNLTKSGVRFLHNTGTRNTFLGASAGNFTLTGTDNTASGNGALTLTTTGAFNTAHGAQALVRNTSGIGNTGVGSSALDSATTGSRNTALGTNAGASLSTGSHNIFVGADVTGTATDTNTMRLGLPYDSGTGAGQNRTFIAGIAGTVLTTPAVQVFVDANGQLGTLVPAPFTGTIDSPLSANPRPDAALLQELAEQRALIAELRARLARLEALVQTLAGRR